MKTSFGAVLAALLTLSACVSAPKELGPDGRPLPTPYVIGQGDVGRVTYSMLDSLNSIRSKGGLAPLTLNAQLTAAAATHSRDMAVQNRPWHFGSDGSSPIVRAQRAGYTGRVLGENISETYENEIETLTAWMQVKATRETVMDPQAKDVGFSWYQEPSGKIWWTMVTGG